VCHIWSTNPPKYTKSENDIPLTGVKMTNEKTSQKKVYGKVSVPQALLDRVDTYLKKHPEGGYTSVTDFVKSAIREKLGELEK